MLKTKVLKFLTRSNAFAPIRLLNRYKIPILMYHRFSREEEFGKTSQKTFEAHLNYLTKHYKIIPLEDAVNRLERGDDPPQRSVVITIDDGYRDFYDIAFPILKKFNVPATLYIVTEFVDGKNWIWTDKARYILARTSIGSWEFEIGEKSVKGDFSNGERRLHTAAAINSEMKKMPDAEKDLKLQRLALEMYVPIPDVPPAEFKAFGWDEAREMQGSKIEIGSHTATHPILTNVDEERLVNELRASKLTLEDKLQKRLIHFCYPNGNVLKRERDAVEKAGYASAVTTELRLCENGDDPFMLPRIDAESEMHRFVQATSGFDQLKG